MPGAQLEVVGVASEGSAGAEFELRGELLDAETTAPALRRSDLVFICTPPRAVPEIVRAALHAAALCIDCSGVMAQQPEVAMPLHAAEPDSESPLVAVPSAATLAWAPLLEALAQAPGLTRVVGTVLQSASALGRAGLVSLSEESIALFNQSEIPEIGPAGQGVAFDVIPNAVAESRTAAELQRVIDPELRIDVMHLQVPTFVGEGASLSIELASPLAEADFAKRLAELADFECVAEGIGSRGLVPVEAGMREPTGPTLRDSAGAEKILVGGIRADASLAAGLGWRVWLSYDPARVVAVHAIRLASLRLHGR